VRAIIVGIDGLVGRALADALRSRGDGVFGTTRRPDMTSPGKVGLLDLVSGRMPIDMPDADVAVICAAMTNLAECRSHPDLAEHVNFRGPVELAHRFSERGVRTIFLSSNAVFDCSAPAMPAEAIKAPKSLYGRLKSAAEDAMLSAHQPATVVRLTKILVPALPVLVRWSEALHRGEQIEAAADHRISPVQLEYVVASLLAIADRGEAGIYQVSAMGDVSYGEIALRMAARIGASASLVSARRAIEIGIPPEEVMAFTSLDASRLTRLTGIAAPDPYEAIDRAIETYTP
jgi:dTDP-4-dehydrorhamnose reductase